MKLIAATLALASLAMILAACRDIETEKLAVGLTRADVERIAGEPSEKVTGKDDDGSDLYREWMKCPIENEVWIYKRWFSDDVALGFDGDGKTACIDRLKVLEITTVH